MEKVEEELGELKKAIQHESKEAQQAELGDLLFSVAQLARHLDFDAEQSLRQTNQRFEKRFSLMQELAKKDGLNFEDLKFEKLETYWQKAKKLLAK